MAADDDGLKSGKIRYKSCSLWMNTDVWGSLNGADNRSRTYDLRITNALLYQLSYIGPERPVTSVTTGQKVRSIRVMRQCPFESNGYFCITRDYLRTNRIVTEADPLVSGKCFEAHRTARVQFLRADRHFCAQPKLSTVGEAGGGIHIHSG